MSNWIAMQASISLLGSQPTARQAGRRQPAASRPQSRRAVVIRAQEGDDGDSTPAAPAAASDAAASKAAPTPAAAKSSKPDVGEALKVGLAHLVGT